MTSQPKAALPLPLPEVKGITEQLLGDVQWEADTRGLCTCPGEGLHTSPTKKRDCQIYVNGAPTIYCFHSSCAGAVENANFSLRSAIGKAKVASSPVKFIPTVQEQIKRGGRLRQKRIQEELAKRGADSLPLILKQFSGGPADLCESSPVRLTGNPEGHGRMLLHLFPEDATVWTGDRFNSASDDQSEAEKAAARKCFRTAGAWLDMDTPPAGPLICPCTFIAGSHSRCNANVESQPFLVVESDVLTHDEFVAVIRFLQQSLRLRAVVNTAGKSLHAWFDYPTESQVAELRVILKELGCDPAMFTPSQPVRFPGAKRFKEENGRQVFMGIQSLLYLDV
jgi:hypothetical protein